MSTWTSRAGAVAALGAVALVSAGGCTAPGGAGSAPREVTVARGALVVVAPPGYCIDESATRDSEEASFVLIASCASLASGRVRGPAVAPALVTVTVSARDPALAEPDARALAAASGATRVLAMRQAGALALVHLGEGGDAALPGGDPRHWRGATVEAGRVVGFAAYAPLGSSVAGEEGGTLLAGVAARLRAGPAPATATAPATVPPGGGPFAAIRDLFT
ncbi:dihydroxy-acid dehydratase [Rhodosalinus sp. K401]|uniref:dihydroxy-acid dehydratase n=1 Tax=Rhodosalinus sp. K401 TaxID=3239195 RepID=UPI003526C0B9